MTEESVKYGIKNILYRTESLSQIMVLLSIMASVSGGPMQAAVCSIATSKLTAQPLKSDLFFK